MIQFIILKIYFYILKKYENIKNIKNISIKKIIIIKKFN